MELKIFNKNPHLKGLTPFALMATDFTILNGIISRNPTYEKGRKLKCSYYLDTEQSNLAIEKLFDDVMDKDGFFTALKMKIVWYDVFNHPVLVKDHYIALSTTQSAYIITKRRKRQINYLQESGIRMGVKQYIDVLFGYYSAYLVGGKTFNLLNNYIENGTKELESAIKSETNKDLLQILNTVLPNKVTVRDAFLEQIT